MITAMYHAKKEVGNSKSDMPTKIGISFFLNALHIEKD
jgi:hypothetical protein